MRRSRNRATAKKAKIVFVASLLLFTVTIFLCQALERCEPMILSLAENRFKNIVTNTVYDISKDIDLSDVVIPCYNDSNEISSISTDAQKINSATTKIVENIESRLEDKDINIKIPLGDLIDDSLSLGQGPYITLQLNQYKSTYAAINSEFESEGINHTLHRLTLELEVEALVLLPGVKTGKISARVSLPLSETLIVGETPSTYIDR